MDLKNPRNSQVIDAFRTCAMLHVIFAHGMLAYALAINDPEKISALIVKFPSILNFLWHTYSVDVFFVVSALLICLSLLREQREKGGISIRSHFLRRVSRILPMYYMILVLYVALQGNSTEEILLSIFFLGFVFGDGSVMNVGGWAIEALAHSYIFLPFLIMGMYRVRWPFLLLVGLILASVAGRYFYILSHPEWDVPSVYLFNFLLESELFNEVYHRSWFRVSPFLIGLGLAYLVTAHREKIERIFAKRINRSLLFGLGLVLIVPTAWIPLHDASSSVHQLLGESFFVFYLVMSHTLVSLGCACLLLAIFASPSGHRSIPGKRFWNFFAQNIYAVFLFHPIFVLLALVAVFRTTDPAKLGDATVWHFFGVFFLATAMTLALAYPMTRYLALFVQNLLRRSLQKDSKSD